MWRLASARTTPLWMEPDEHAAVAASAVLVKRYFVPKPPAPRGPPLAGSVSGARRVAAVPEFAEETGSPLFAECLSRDAEADS